MTACLPRWVGEDLTHDQRDARSFSTLNLAGPPSMCARQRGRRVASLEGEVVVESLGILGEVSVGTKVLVYIRAASFGRLHTVQDRARITLRRHGQEHR